jgi:subfamily B ATP-binding cassette protein HlyB/CyaB
MLLRFHGLGADPEQIRHRFGAGPIDIPEMLRCAKELGLKARSRVTRWERLVSTPLPGIVTLRDGGFLLLAKVGDDKALVQSPLSPRPTMMTRAELEAVWDGRLVLMTRRAGLTDLSRRFDITWFLGAKNVMPTRPVRYPLPGPSGPRGGQVLPPEMRGGPTPPCEAAPPRQGRR